MKNPRKYFFMILKGSFMVCYSKFKILLRYHQQCELFLKRVTNDTAQALVKWFRFFCTVFFFLNDGIAYLEIQHFLITWKNYNNGICLVRVWFTAHGSCYWKLQFLDCESQSSWGQTAATKGKDSQCIVLASFGFVLFFFQTRKLT